MNISHYKLYSRKIDRKYRIALVADVHGCDIDDLRAALREIGPDIITVPGDIEGAGPREARVQYARSFIDMCASVSPTFVSLGNHDVDITHSLVAECGARLLTDEYAEHEGIVIGGLTSGSLGKKHKRFGKTPAPDLEFISSFACLDSCKLLLSHHPEYFKQYLSGQDIDFVFSGHAHGGQWRFFGRGVFSPGQGLFPKYTSGVYEGCLVVSRAAGDHNGIPRIFNKNEICCVEILPHPQR